MSHKRKSYTSDLSAGQWEIVRVFLPFDNAGPGRPLKLDMRQVMNTILYINKTSCQWANLPHDFPNHNSVYYHYRTWCRDGTWERLNRALGYEARRQAGRCPHPSAAIIDRQSVKTTEVGGERGYDAGKKVIGS